MCTALAIPWPANNGSYEFAAVLLCSHTFISIIDNFADSFNLAVMVNGICIGCKGVFLSFSTYKLYKTIRSCHCVAER